VGKLLGRQRWIFENNIKMDIVCEDGRWIELAKIVSGGGF
jgi:hypothetical protein